MKKIKRYSCLLLCIMIAFTIINGSMVYAASDITAKAVIDGRNITISGQISGSEGEQMVGLLLGRSKKNIIYVDQVWSDASGAFCFSFPLPENLPAKTYWYRIGTSSGPTGYEGTIKYKGYTPAQTHSMTVSGIAGDVVSVVAKGQNISSFTNKTFELEYDPTQLHAVDLFGFSSAESLNIGQEGNVEIVSYTPGRIAFKVNNITVPTGKVWNGVLNLFKFKFAADHNGGSILSIKER